MVVVYSVQYDKKYDYHASLKQFIVRFPSRISDTVSSYTADMPNVSDDGKEKKMS